MDRFFVKWILISVVAFGFEVFSAHPGSAEDKGDLYKAISIEYKAGVEGEKVIHKEFESRIYRFKTESLEILEIHNFFSKDSKEPDRKVKITMSGEKAISSIYDKDGKLIAEFQGGVVVNPNLIQFDLEGDESWSRGEWIISENGIASLFQTFSKGDQIIYSELVTYIKPGS